MTAREVTSYARWFLATLGRQFMARDCARAAAALTFTTLIAAVPFIAVIYRVLSLMPLFDDTGDVITGFIFENFVAGSSDIVVDKLREFSANANQLTLAGIIFLFVTTMLLLMNVERTFNAIWDVADVRRGAARFFTYWGVITLAVPLIGAAVVAASYDFGLSFIRDLDAGLYGAWLPPIATAATFTLLYYAVPSTPVRIAHALAGGVVTAAVFEGAKNLFGALVPLLQHQFVYGTFAALPLFLMGLYLLWALVLAGALFVRTLGLKPPPSQSSADSPLLMRCLAVLRMLRDAHLEGGSVDDAAVDAAVELRPGERERVFDALKDTGLAVRVNADEGWVLGRSLAQVTLWDLCRRLPDGLDDALVGNDQVAIRLQAFSAHVRVELGVGLDHVLKD